MMCFSFNHTVSWSTYCIWEVLFNNCIYNLLSSTNISYRPS